MSKRNLHERTGVLDWNDLRTVLAYNLLFRLNQRDWAATPQGVEKNIFLQIIFDLVALALLLCFADLPRNR